MNTSPRSIPVTTPPDETQPGQKEPVDPALPVDPVDPPDPTDPIDSDKEPA